MANASGKLRRPDRDEHLALLSQDDQFAAWCADGRKPGGKPWIRYPAVSFAAAVRPLR
jgi:hypothetical protein